MLKSINLSLSTLCQANCVYCPPDRGVNLKEKNMPLRLIRKITAELNSDKFKASHDVKLMQLSENGDALMNRDFITILRHLKERVPKVKKILYTNLALLDKNKSKIILKEGLIDRLICSIDSIDERTFNKINDLNFKKVMKNFKNFLEIRNNLNSDIGVIVGILTLHSYANSIKNSFGFLPKNIIPFEVPMIDEADLIYLDINRFLDPKTDFIRNSIIFGWNERDNFTNVKTYLSDIECPFLDRNQTELFIGPDGSCYSCCLDHKPDTVFGNVHKNSMNEIFNMPSRKLFLEQLENKEFIKAGGPCKTVVCCLNVRK